MKPKYLLSILGVLFLVYYYLTIDTFKSLSGSDLSKGANVGTAISGILSPIIGVISIILLYLALSRQTESNIEQRLKNESDIIFTLINQMDDELQRFYTKISKTKGENKIELTERGIEGLMYWSRQYKFDLTDDFFKDKEITFRSFYESHQIILLIKSFQLIERRIEIATLTDEIKRLFRDKLDSYYQSKLRLKCFLILGV
ncbi:hypothetical protein BBH99_00200 [Chryseobacterium contaminans]|uniref:Phage abortive infection protein n=1 Tax=Chryseobacterium contaminans TaxID=1423959 RepID=A0A1M6VLY0_9FLAO|nr:hypothetical protein [Chryseobacterium contaminans]OCA80558.1 hypothetical protein BBH99_00200 [Chryseobacterium contaminans]SHK82503.1 hypothetical protein SAMN05444407_101273 [Chryseobacterium contaminans]